MNPWLFADTYLSSPPSVTSVANHQLELTDTLTCVVDREVNGIYELTMTYPITGALYDQIGPRCLLYVAPDDVSGRQLFRIYRISKPLMGIVTINARHIAYDLSGYICPPFTASGIQAALSGITADTQPTPCPFTFSSSRSTASNFIVNVPTAIWSLMAGQEGSLLDVYGGEFTFDNFNISLENRVGADNGVTIEYGKNLTKLTQDENSADLYTGIYPYYYSDEGGLVTLTEEVVDGSGSWSFDVYKAVDFTDKFESTPTEAQLRAAAQAYVANNNVGELKMTLDVEFIPLWQTEEYKNDARERVNLGDGVTIRFDALGVDATARIMATKYNCLKERFDKLTVGSIKTDLATVITNTAQNSVQSVQPGTPVATVGAVTNHAVTVTPSVTNVTGYIQGGTRTGTAVTVSASQLVSGTKNITANGNNIDVTNYEKVNVAVPGGGGGGTYETVSTSVTPSESTQSVTLTASSGYDAIGTATVTVSAISSTYIGSGVTTMTTSDLAVSGATVTAPAGYYSSAASKSVASGTAGTPTATKGTVTNHSVTVTPKVTNTTGYISGGTKTGTAVTVTASELVSGNLTLTAVSGDCTNYATVSVTEGSLGEVFRLRSKIPANSPTQLQVATWYPNATDGWYTAISGVHTETTFALQTETVTPTASTQTVTPTSNAYYLNSVTVKPIPSEYIVPTGNLSLTANTTNADCSQYATVTVNVSGGDSTFVVTLSYNSTSQQWEPNKTYAEISAAYSGGKTIVVNTTEASDNVTADGEMASNIFYYVVRQYSNATYHSQTRNLIKEQYYELRSNGLTLADENTYPLPSGTLSLTASTTNADAAAYAYVTVNVPSGIGTLLKTTSLGSLSTSSTSSTDTGKTMTLTGYNDYDLLIVDVSVDTLTNNRHTSTVSTVLLTGTSNVNTKNTYTVGSNKWNSKLSSSGTGTTRQSTSAYGIYVNSATVSSSTMTLTFYYRYNSNNTGTINGTYTARVYGVKLYDLIGG